MNVTPYKYSKVDLDWIENRTGIIGFDGSLVTLEIIGQKIAKFKEEVEKLKQMPKSNKVAPFVEQLLEDSKNVLHHGNISKKHPNAKLGKRI